MRIGTRGLLTITCPRPASVGARMAARIPASHRESPPRTTRAPIAPSKMVSNIPVLRRRTGTLRFPPKARRLMWLASVKSNITRPTSAIRRRPFRSSPRW
jgi:hypothetical protein